MPNITIIVKGIAICYAKGNLWKVLFPINANEHIVKFTGPNNVAEPLALEGRKIEIEIGSPSSSFGNNPGDFNNFLDLTGAYAHPDIKPGSTQGVLLSIPNATFSQYEETICDYQLMEKGVLVHGPRKIGYSASFTLSGTDVEMLIDPPHPAVSSSINSDCVLVFDNSCPGRDLPDNADFVMVYDVVNDTLQKGRQFEMERYPGHKPSFLSIAFKKLFGTLARVDNPDLYDPGLPCNVVVSTKSDNLD